SLAPFMTSSVRNSGTATEATFETRPYKLHKLETPPNSTTSCTRDEALTFYTQMQMIRRMESAASNLYKEKGAQVPVGAGIALANKYLENNGINVSLYGDGAANQGQLFEAYNIAKLMNLPAVLFVRIMVMAWVLVLTEPQPQPTTTLVETTCLEYG
ncbi:putative pyruvate dehydrogenase E1 component subunit alpha, mitochondrial, partial [Penaeus vannamei]